MRKIEIPEPIKKNKTNKEYIGMNTEMLTENTKSLSPTKKNNKQQADNLMEN